MDDDGSKNLDYPEFRKGVGECGLELQEDEYKVRSIDYRLSRLYIDKSILPCSVKPQMD